MSLVAEVFDYVVGVDTHAERHSFAVVGSVGKVVDSAEFPTTEAGFRRALSWIQRRTPGRRVIAVECIGSYGSTLAKFLTAEGELVVEAKPPRRADRARNGKSDAIDAIAAARSVLAGEETDLIDPRASGHRSALRVLLVARRLLDSQRTADRNALTALVRTEDLGVDARNPLTDAQIASIARWRDRDGETVWQRIIRAEARRLAESVVAKMEQLRENEKSLQAEVSQVMAGLLNICGVGPVVAATLLVAWSHPGRIKTEAGFAMLSGVAPLQASSGKTQRHRLNRGGDRALNRAMDIIAKTRIRVDPATREYVNKRTAQGKSRKEITRCLKRYIARSLFRQMNQLADT